MSTNNIQNTTRRALFTTELICSIALQFPCVALRNITNTMRTVNSSTPLFFTVGGATLGFTVSYFTAHLLTYSSTVATVTNIASTLSSGLLSGCLGFYCAKKTEAHQSSPDPKTDNELMLQPITEPIPNAVAIHIEQE